MPGSAKELLVSIYSEWLYVWDEIKKLPDQFKIGFYSAFDAAETWSIKDVKLVIRDPLISPNIKKAILKENYEQGENEIIRMYLEPGEKLLEVGSGIGFNSITAAKITGSKNVITYEANPELIRLIRKNFALNKVDPALVNAILVNDHEEDKSFHISNEFWASSTVQESTTAKSVQVRTENFLETIHRFMPQFMVVDIEGGEIDLLSIPLPYVVRKLCLDTHPFFQEVGEKKTSDLVKALLEQGFTLNITAQRGYVLYFTR